MGFRLLPLASADLEEIAQAIATDNPVAAGRWLDAMLEHCRRLGGMPGIGVAREDIRPGLKLFPAGNYLILYRETQGHAEIVRIVHGARTWWRLL